jgi:hypothetical protein
MGKISSRGSVWARDKRLKRDAPLLPALAEKHNTWGWRG